MTKMGRFGVIGSLVYVLIIVCFHWSRLPSLGEMELNAFGDFLAGVFGPLAIFWLVLGFFQQGAELRNSAKALELQATELKSSVEQQKALAEVSNKQLELQKSEFSDALKRLSESKMPKFVISYNGIENVPNSPYNDSDSGPLKHILSVANIGGTACEVEITLAYGDLQPNGPKVIWPQFEVIEFWVELFANDTHGDVISLSIRFRDADGKAHIVGYNFTRVTHGERPNFEVTGPFA